PDNELAAGPKIVNVLLHEVVEKVPGKHEIVVRRRNDLRLADHRDVRARRKAPDLELIDLHRTLHEVRPDVAEVHQGAAFDRRAEAVHRLPALLQLSQEIEQAATVGVDAAGKLF